MKKTELLERVRAAYARLDAALEGLGEDEATRVGLTPEWSVKDALAHITMWEQEGLRVMDDILAGTYRPRFDNETIERRNREAVEARRARNFAEVSAELREAHARLEALLGQLPEEVDERSPSGKFIAGVTYDHMAHHAAQIEKYRSLR